MDNLVFSCTAALDQPIQPACTTDYGSAVVGIAFMKKGGTFICASSDYPTKGEFDTAIIGDAVTFYGGISNGQRLAKGGTELSGDDVVNGGSQMLDEVYEISGRIKIINEAISRATEKLTRYSELRMWYFTEKNYVFGGKTGYLVSPYFGLKIQEGRKMPPYIPFRCTFVANGTDQAGYDNDFDLLVNS